MKTSIVILISLASLVAVAVGEESTPKLNLPGGAVVIETEALKSKGYPNRAIVLWMLTPVKHPSGAQEDPDYSYSCPDHSRGSYYSGPARVSLVDTGANTIINTIEIKQEYFKGEDSFDIPYAIRKGYYYQVDGNPSKDKEVRPRLMWLRDYNGGDGNALEFALFDALACMGLPTTLIGYSVRQDKVIQYLIQLEVKGDNERSVRVSHWCDYLFSQKPQSPGYWRYKIDYRGRGGSLDKYEIRYDAEKEVFEGTFVRTADSTAE